VGEYRDTAQDRVTIQEAARRLGVKEDAIRKRIQRDTLPHEKTEEGRVFVWLDTAQDTAQDAYRDTAQAKASAELVAELRAHNETLHAQLEAAHERDRENRRIIAALTQRIPAIEAREDAPESAEARPDTATPTGASEGTEKAAERRSWWQRIFGG
jgi:hypothetical protein